MSGSNSLFTPQTGSMAMSEVAETSDITGTIQARICRVLAEDLCKSRFSRPDVAGRLGISLAMLDAYVATTKPHRFPAEMIPAWIRVLQSRRILDVICEACGLSAATEEDRDFAELGRTRLRDEKLTRKLWERV